MNSQTLAEDLEHNADVDACEIKDDNQIAFTRPYMPYNLEEKDNIIILSKETKMAEFYIPEEKYHFVCYEPVYPIEFNQYNLIFIYYIPLCCDLNIEIQYKILPGIDKGYLLNLQSYAI